MMEHRCIKARKATLKKSRSNTFINNGVKERVTLDYIQSKSTSLITNTTSESQQSLIVQKYPNSVHRSNCRISKRITSFDDQYLSHCLELIQISAAKAISSTESNFASPRNVLTFSSKRWNKSMIVRSPLFKHGMSQSHIDNGSEDFSFPSVKGSLESYGDCSPIGFSSCSSPFVELLSSDRTSCTWPVPIISHGLLRCTMRNEITHFVFSTDHNREIYTTRLSKPALSDGTCLDWTYIIYSSKSNGKLESNLVGRINVATRYKFSDKGFKIMETEFVLYGDNECQDQAGELEKRRRVRRLPGKVSNFFKPMQRPKHRSKTDTWGTSTSLELSSMTLEDDVDIDNDHIRCPNLLDSNIPSNFELAAIVVKERVGLNQPENVMGGWGLNFLKSATEKQAAVCRHDCKSAVERSMDVLVPTGVHGGPKPSSLIERSRNRGQCDCGGWDIGCPLSQLTTRLDNEDVRNSLNLYLKGEEGCVGAPSMKMENIGQNGLYSVEYLPRLSALQCFSIAVAVVHSRNPTLQSNT